MLPYPPANFRFDRPSQLRKVNIISHFRIVISVGFSEDLGKAVP